MHPLRHLILTPNKLNRKQVVYVWKKKDVIDSSTSFFMSVNTTQKLVFTGGKIPWDKSNKTEEVVLKEYAIQMVYQVKTS
jgi:hypothetical protein